MKAIYMPKGAAGEYAKYACNLYKGCSNGCTYCYLRRGVLKHACGGDKPVLKSCFKDDVDAIRVYRRELQDLIKRNDDIKKHGIFFTFTSDPCLPETIALNSVAIKDALNAGIPVRILTKCTEWINTFGASWQYHPAKANLSVGFTLTGRDDMEPHAAPNAERINAMRLFHAVGIRTWASVEPVIDLEASKRCILDTIGFCDEYKIGLLSGGKRNYSREEVADFVDSAGKVIQDAGAKVDWKESVRKFIGNIE